MMCASSPIYNLYPANHSLLAVSSPEVMQGSCCSKWLLGWKVERTFFDVRVFNPQAPSNRSSQPAATYRRHEREKRLHYEQRVLEVEHASFVPFVMSCTGGAGPCATVVLKRHGALLAEKHNSSYSTVMGLLRCRLNFALIRSSVMCLRGSRLSFRRPGRFDMTAADIALTEGHVAPL